MKVLVVTNMYPMDGHPYYGIFVKEQVDSLKEAGCDVDVFFINGRESKLNYVRTIPALARKLRSGGYDIIHAHHTYCIFPLLFARAPAGRRAPLVFTFHEGESHLPWEMRPEDAGLLKKLVFVKGPKRFALNRADMVIAVADGLLDNLRFKGKCMILPPGIDLDLFRPIDRSECREKLGLPIDDTILFFPPSPAKRHEKGLDLLDEAIPLVADKKIRLITGGEIPHEEMPRYMCASDVVIHPSRFEASPMVIKEAMACSVPVVSSDTGDARTVIGDTAGCHICALDPEDIARKIETALRFGRPTTGRERIIELELGLNQVAENIRLIYEDLLSGFGKRGAC